MDIAGDDDLLVCGDQLVIQIEEDLLRSRLLHALDIVDEQEIAFHESLLDLFHGVAMHVLGLHGVDQQRDDIFAVYVDDPGIRAVDFQVIADRMQQMGLSQTGVAIDHQRIVELSGIIAAGDRCRIGFPVVFADDEIIECVQLIEMIFKKRIRALPHHLLRNHLFHIFVQDDLQRIVATGCLGEGRTPDVQAAREDRTGNFIWDRNQRHIIIDAEQSGRFDIGVEYGIIVSIAVFDDLESGIPQLLVIFFRYSHNRPLSTHPFYTNLWGNTMSTL